jgi:DNA-binding transcriptional LysR family regulator
MELNLDLNLLVALDALLQERSVTRAAARLGLTQPTLSHSLARLRRHFRDDLLYRSGNSYDLTPLAVQLAGRTAVALDGVQRIFAVQPQEIATSTRQFALSCSDYGAAVVGPPLSAALAAQAPQARVHFRFGDPTWFASDDDRLRAVDGLIMPHGFLRGLPHIDLFSDRWVCLVSNDNTSVGAALTMADLKRLPWAAAFTGPSPGTTGLRQLEQLGVQPQVQVVVNGFVTLPLFISGTDRICMLPHRVASLMAPSAGLRVLECPFDAVPVVQALWWHPVFERDAEHAWLRQLLASTMAAASA